MAIKTYSLAVGQNYSQVVEGDTTTIANNVEVAIDLSAVQSKDQAILAIENIKNYIIQSKFAG